MKPLGLFLSFFSLTVMVRAQEINFSRVQDMTVWYNQSLKTDKENSLKLNFRNVNFDGMIAYNSISAMVDVPLLSREQKDAPQTGYVSVSLGAASDKSNQGIFNNTLGLAGISYAIPVGEKETYVAMGFQASYYQSQLNTFDMVAFGDQYDKYGPIQGRQSDDPLATGWSYNYLNMNAGLSMFGNDEFNKWYLGASVMHINKPYSDDLKTEAYRLRPSFGVQGGYRFITPEYDDCAFNMSLNWRGNAFKHFFNASYFKSIKSLNGGVGAGLGYRFDDALVPNIEIRYVKAIMAISYDMNVSGITAAGFKRNGMELALKLEF